PPPRPCPPPRCRSLARAGSPGASRGRRPRLRPPARVREVASWRRRPCSCHLGARGGEGKRHLEHGTSAGPWLRLQPSAVLADDGVADRKAEAGRVLGREERLEDALA